MVPTVDTVRYQYLTQNLIKALYPVMLVGPVGTGKTSVAENTLSKLDPKSYSVLTVNMSAQVGFETWKAFVHQTKVQKYLNNLVYCQWEKAENNHCRIMTNVRKYWFHRY